MKAYRERSGLSISTGNFYRELQRLVGNGLVQTASNPAGADPRRAPYEITAGGTAAFDAWLSGSPGGMGYYEDELSSRAIFVAEAAPATTRRVLEVWREELWLRSKILERARETAVGDDSGDDSQPFTTLAFLLARRLKHVAADLEFLEELRSAYESWIAATVPPPRALARQAVRARSETPPARGATGGGRGRV